MERKIMLQQEKDLKRFLEKSEKEVKRLERDEGQMRKKIKKLQEAAEKKRRKREKELADENKRVSFVRRQYALDRQAVTMELLAKGRRGGSSTMAGPTSPVADGTPISEPEDTITASSSASSLERYGTTQP